MLDVIELLISGLHILVASLIQVPDRIELLAPSSACLLFLSRPKAKICMQNCSTYFYQKVICRTKKLVGFFGSSTNCILRIDWIEELGMVEQSGAFSITKIALKWENPIRTQPPPWNLKIKKKRSAVQFLLAMDFQILYICELWKCA